MIIIIFVIVSSGVVVSGRCKGTLCIKCFNLSGKTIWKNAVPDLDRIYALCHVKDGPREWLIVSKLNKLEVRHAESGIVKQTIDTKFTTISLSSMSMDSRSFLCFRDDGKISHFIIHESILTDKRQTLSTHLNFKSGCWMELACDPIVVITLSAPSEGVVRAVNYPTGTCIYIFFVLLIMQKLGGFSCMHSQKEKIRWFDKSQLRSCNVNDTTFLSSKLFLSSLRQETNKILKAPIVQVTYYFVRVHLYLIQSLLRWSQRVSTNNFWESKLRLFNLMEGI